MRSTILAKARVARLTLAARRANLLKLGIACGDSGPMTPYLPPAQEFMTFEYVPINYLLKIVLTLAKKKME